ncbi:SDR family oxidoreductase [Herbaspirillum sp. NPDC101396]|uniref:SDR family oxidoreductase n=1 Tax=Herbaspirillum sp. NPDC101396 TaxID=3364005 RepID=UPI00383BC9D1
MFALLILYKAIRRERQNLAGLVGGFTATELKGNSMKLTGNTILLTGGTSGIGRALAEALHDRGNRVIVTGRRQALLDEITNARPGLVGLKLDVNDATSLAQLSLQMRERFPQLNVLIANAGISHIEDMASDDWTADDAEAIVQTNILGVLRVAAAILPLLKGKPNAAFLATSSALAFVPRADFPTYCASKAFLHSWLQSLRHQMRGFPIEVLELSPPYVQTGLTGAHQINDPRAMPLQDYLAEVLRLLENSDTPRGEVLLERDLPRRWAERDGGYDAMFAVMNPA